MQKVRVCGWSYCAVLSTGKIVKNPVPSETVASCTISCSVVEWCSDCARMCETNEWSIQRTRYEPAERLWHRIVFPAKRPSNREQVRAALVVPARPAGAACCVEFVKPTSPLDTVVCSPNTARQQGRITLCPKSPRVPAFGFCWFSISCLDGT